MFFGDVMAYDMRDGSAFEEAEEVIGWCPLVVAWSHCSTIV